VNTFVGSRTDFTKSLSGSRRLDLWATREIAVLSPPGMIRASHVASSVSFRTSKKDHLHMYFDPTRLAACLRSWMCSLKAPCRAKTPTVIVPPKGDILPVLGVGLLLVVNCSGHEMMFEDTSPH